MKRSQPGLCGAILPLQESRSLQVRVPVLAHLQVLTGQTQLGSRLLLQHSEDPAGQDGSRGVLSADTRVNYIPFVTEASCGLCKADMRWRSAQCKHTATNSQPRTRLGKTETRPFVKPALWLHRFALQTSGSLFRKGSWHRVLL